MIKVFQLNEFEWWAGDDIEACITEAMKTEQISREDLFDEGEAHELSKEEMELLQFNEDSGDKVSFEKHLEEMISLGIKFPCFFATTEF